MGMFNIKVYVNSVEKLFYYYGDLNALLPYRYKNIVVVSVYNIDLLLNPLCYLSMAISFLNKSRNFFCL